MPNRMERFTQEARQVLSYAQEEAVNLGDMLIDAEHVLLGLLRVENSYAYRALVSLSLELSTVREIISRQKANGIEPLRKQTHIDLSHNVKKLLEFAVDEARRLGRHYIDTEHLLLGLLRLSDSRGLDIVRQRVTSIEAFREGIHRVLSGKVTDFEPIERGQFHILPDSQSTSGFRIVLNRAIPDQGLSKLCTVGEVLMWDGELPPPKEAVIEAVKNADAILSILTDTVDREVMDAAPNLKVISNFAVGYDNIDVQAATERKIPVGNTPGVLTESSADLAFALLMTAARRIVEGERYIRAGKWRTWGPKMLLGQDIYGATLGIIGLGRIGQAVARRAQGFDMKVLYYGGSDEQAARELGVEKVSFDDLLQRSDFVSIHVPLDDTTYHMIGDRELRLMKPNAILINTSRGGTVDPVALYQALKEEQIWAAALDVTEPEPITLDDPLLTLENCIIVPHIASASLATRELMGMMAVDNLIAGLQDERLPNCVNPEVYE